MAALDKTQRDCVEHDPQLCIFCGGSTVDEADPAEEGLLIGRVRCVECDERQPHSSHYCLYDWAMWERCNCAKCYDTDRSL